MGIRTLLETFLVFAGRGDQIMKNKADKVRQALIKGASPHRLAQVMVERCQRDHPQVWISAAVAQLAQILGISLVNARVLISEHCMVQTNWQL